MNGREFVHSLEESMLNDDLIMVRVVEPGSPLDGRMFSVKQVSQSDEADTNTYTTWIEITEY